MNRWLIPRSLNPQTYPPVLRLCAIAAGFIAAVVGTSSHAQSIKEVRTMYDRTKESSEVVRVLGGDLGVLELAGMVENIDAIGVRNISFAYVFGGAGSVVKAKVHSMSEL